MNYLYLINPVVIFLLLGIRIVRTELKEIDPPKDVQETMNKMVKERWKFLQLFLDLQKTLG